LALEPELGFRKEPMLTAFLPDADTGLEDEVERPPSTESSSSKFLSGGREVGRKEGRDGVSEEVVRKEERRQGPSQRPDNRSFDRHA
jgi:hypothetical protein